MRRKLIKQDAFERITNESVTAAERELVEAAPIVAKALGRDSVSLKSFTESTVMYETRDNSYVHAGYEIKNGQITFNNIEELVIDESSRRQKMRGVLSEMIDSLLVDNHAKAEQHFSDYLTGIRWDEVKSNLNEGFPFKKGKKDKKHDKDDDDSKGKKEFFFKKSKKAGKDVCEAYVTGHNVLDYVKYMKIGPTLAESLSKSDDKGNVTDLRIPTLRERNESKLQRFDWKTLNTKVADSRKKIPHFAENQDFCKAMAHLKRQNKFSDLQALEEALDHVVKYWPDLLYATQTELSEVIGESLQTAGVRNYDDETCEFMAEAILKKAHGAYTEKVGQILHLASAPKMEAGVDAYRFFQHVVEQFYPAVDEKFGLERQVFTDLYNSLGTIYKKADRQGDNALKSEAAAYLNELADVLNGKAKIDLELAEESARFLTRIIETNLESGKWVVSNSPHLTVNGDHPDMAKKAGHGYTPSKDFSGDWGDEAPAIGQDNHNYKSGKNAKTMRNNSWGQAGDSGDIFPKLKNPYVPKPFGDYSMKGEKGVDKENNNFSLWKTGDTWPELNNPYVPKEAGGPGGTGYKMKDGKDTDLVVDR